MFTTKCPYCKSANVKKNGIRKGSQFYRCNSCGKQFYGKIRRLSSEAIWEIYLEGKQTITEIAQTLHISESTVKRRLRQKILEWRQPILYGKHGFVHVDATYWGHNWGIILAIDEATGEVLFLAFIKHETTQSYIDAITAIEAAGYIIQGIIIDGKQELFTAFADYPIQMCQFHMIQIVKRY